MYENVDCWQPRPARLSLAEGEVHVWRARLGHMTERIAELGKLLPFDEMQRARCFIFDRDRDHWVASRGFLRTILSLYIDTPPRSLWFQYGRYGKPSLSPPFDRSCIRFSVSHAGNMTLIAVARSRELGVDGERIRRIPGYDDVSLRFFSTEEDRQIRSLPEEERLPAFFACWTRKEAVIKALGGSFPLLSDQVIVSVRPDSPAVLIGVPPLPPGFPDWYLKDLPLGIGYTGALCVEGKECTLSLYDCIA